MSTEFNHLMTIPGTVTEVRECYQCGLKLPANWLTMFIPAGLICPWCDYEITVEKSVEPWFRTHKAAPGISGDLPRGGHHQ